MEKQEQDLRTSYGESVETRVMELRAEPPTEGKMVLEGYAARFGDITDLGFFNERISRGAFDNVLNDDVRFLLNHDGMPLARTTNGSLKMEARDEGLWTRAELNDTQAARDVYAAVQRGDITQMSFAFTIAEDSHDPEANLRTIKQVKRMYDVSAVSFPAYPTTTIEARAAYAHAAQPSAAPKPEPPTPPEPATEEAVQQPEKVRTLRGKDLKNMTLNDLKGQRAAYYEEFVAIGKLADEEGRAMTEAEQERADTLDGHVQAIDQKIKHKVREQEMVSRVAYATAPSTSEERAVNSVNYKWSLSRAVAAISDQRQLEGAEAEWTAECQREYRGQGLNMTGHIGIPQIAFRAGSVDNMQAGSGDGSGFVGTDVPAAIEALRAPTLIETLGTTVLQATGNLKFPRVSGASAANITAEAIDQDSAGLTMDEVTMTPENAAMNTAYTKQLLVQGGPAVDALIAADLRGGLIQKVDERAFALIMADNAVNDVSAGTGSSAASGALAVEMEAAVLADGADLTGAVYAMSPFAYQHFKTQALVAGVTALFDGTAQVFNGYRAYATPHIAEGTGTAIGQAIFGNFRQGLILAYFGGVDILVDPFSLAQTGKIQLHANRFFDVAVRQPGALCICDDVKAG